MNLNSITATLEINLKEELAREGILNSDIPDNTEELLEHFYEDVDFESESEVYLIKSERFIGEFDAHVEGGGVIEYVFKDTKPFNLKGMNDILDELDGFVYVKYHDINDYDTARVEVGTIPEITLAHTSKQVMFSGSLITIYENKIKIDWEPEVIYYES